MAVPTTARAVQFDQYGGIDVLQVSSVAVRQPAAGEVLVEVRAAGLNPGEAAIRQGFYDAGRAGSFPLGEGTDLAGVVVAVGDPADAPGAGAAEFAVGDEVIGWSEKRSSQAEYVIVPHTQLIPKPAGISWAVGGSLFVVAVTAYAAVRAVDVASGDTVVVSSAAGGVGTVVVQLLRSKGATVIGIASEANHGWLESLGVVPVSYAARDGGSGASGGSGDSGPATLADRIRALAPGGVDALIDTHGPEYLDLGIELGVAPDRLETIIAFERAGQLGAKAEGSRTASTAAILSEMAALVDAGTITIPIAATYPLADVQAAYTELEKRHTRGKIVLVP